MNSPVIIGLIVIVCMPTFASETSPATHSSEETDIQVPVASPKEESSDLDEQSSINSSDTCDIPQEPSYPANTIYLHCLQRRNSMPESYGTLLLYREHYRAIEYQRNQLIKGILNMKFSDPYSIATLKKEARTLEENIKNGHPHVRDWHTAK